MGCNRESIGTRADDGDLAGIGSSRRHVAMMILDAKLLVKALITMR
jgi:hypothetical protein